MCTILKGKTRKTILSIKVRGFCKHLRGAHIEKCS